MRVVHVVRSDAFAGVERYITYVAPELRRHGVDVVVVGGEPTAMAAALEPAEVEHRPAVTTAQAARQLLRVRPVDLVHAHMSAAESAAVITAPLVRAPIVATRHFAARRGRSAAGRLAAPVIDRVVRQEIAISHFVAAATGRDCVVVQNGVPDRPPAQGTERLVLMAQRLEPEKDTAVGIRAWAASGLAAGGWRLVVAGDGSQLAELRHLAAAEGVAGSVDFLGRRTDLDTWLERTGVFLATAPAEPFGLAVVEAMARAIPVVAAKGGAHLETVGLCSEDWLFPPGDHAACAELLSAVATDDRRRAAYGAALRTVQTGHFRLDNHVARLMNVYTTVIDEG